VLRDKLVLLELAELLVVLELQVLQGLWETQDLRVRRERVEQLDLPGQLDRRVLQGPRVLRAEPGLMVYLE